MEASDQSLMPQQLCHTHIDRDGDDFFSLWIHQERRRDVLYRLEGHLFTDSIPSGFSTLPSDHLE